MIFIEHAIPSKYIMNMISEYEYHDDWPPPQQFSSPHHECNLIKVQNMGSIA